MSQLDEIRRLGRLEEAAPERSDLSLEAHRRMMLACLASGAEPPQRREILLSRAIGKLLSSEQKNFAPLAYVLTLYATGGLGDPILAKLLAGGLPPSAQATLDTIHSLRSEGRQLMAAELLLAMHCHGWLENNAASQLEIAGVLVEAGQTEKARSMLRQWSYQAKQSAESVSFDAALMELSPAAPLFAGHTLGASCLAGIRAEQASLEDERVVQAMVEGQLYSPHSGLPGHYRKRFLEIKTAGPVPDDGFLLFLDDRLALYCELTADAWDGVWEAVPSLLPWGFTTGDAGLARRLLTVALDAAEFLVRRHHGKALAMYVDDGGCFDMETAGPLLAAGYHPFPQPESIVDLRLPQAELWRKLRKSYKSLVSRVGKATTLLRFDREHPSHELVDGSRIDIDALVDCLAYLNHISFLGRFPPELHRLFIEWVMRHGGEICLEWHRDLGLVAGAVIIDYRGESHYCWSRSSGPVLDALTPSAHHLLWECILGAQRRGSNTFVLGETTNLDFVDRKLVEISRFKLGFATALRQQNRWEKLL